MCTYILILLTGYHCVFLFCGLAATVQCRFLLPSRQNQRFDQKNNGNLTAPDQSKRASQKEHPFPHIGKMKQVNSQQILAFCLIGIEHTALFRMGPIECRALFIGLDMEKNGAGLQPVPQSALREKQ